MPTLGQYELIGSRGGKVGKEVTGVKGKPLPPTPKKKIDYKLDHKNKHLKIVLVMVERNFCPCFYRFHFLPKMGSDNTQDRCSL